MKFFLAALLAPVALALPASLEVRSPVPASPLEQRQSCAASCGSSACYYSSTVNNAVSAGCQRYQNNNPVNSYPHTYNNYGRFVDFVPHDMYWHEWTEGFSFSVSGPYQEFPILRNYNSNPYTGGSPGPDRVIFNSGCQLAGVITRENLFVFVVYKLTFCRWWCEWQ
jgi:hypothetical protein